MIEVAVSLMVASLIGSGLALMGFDFINGFTQRTRGEMSAGAAAILLAGVMLLVTLT